MAGQARPPAASRSGGFTLVELLVCLALLAALAMLSLPYVTHGGTSLRLAAESRVLASLLRGAREHALAQRQPVAVRIDLAARSVARQDSPDTLRFSAVERIGVVTGRELSEGQTAMIVFQPDGSSSGALVVLAGGGARRTLRVDWLTGSVTMVER